MRGPFARPPSAEAKRGEEPRSCSAPSRPKAKVPLTSAVEDTSAASMLRRRGHPPNERPVARQDLGKLCQACRQPFMVLGDPILEGGSSRNVRLLYHQDCFVQGEDPTGLTVGRSSAAGPNNRAAQDATRPWQGGLVTRAVAQTAGVRTVSRPLAPRELEILCETLGGQFTAADRDVDCAICLKKLEAGEDVLRLPCGENHQFHVACLTKWWQKCALCPLCRTGVRTFLPQQRCSKGGSLNAGNGYPAKGEALEASHARSRASTGSIVPGHRRTIEDWGRFGVLQ